MEIEVIPPPTEEERAAILAALAAETAAFVQAPPWQGDVTPDP